MRISSTAILLALAGGLVLAPGALADGGPVPPVQGSAIGVPRSPYQYIADGDGRITIVKTLTGGRVAAKLRVAGRYGVPGIDYNGSTTGLSADGRTLILAELPDTGVPRTTRLLVLATPGLALRARLALPGWSTIDAISPNGRWVYLIHYPSSDISRYEVRAYDLPARRLLPEPVVDPRDRGEAMTGFAMTRVMSDDGRWAYTLYTRPSGVPFVHALDTVRRRAVCIDLPALSGADIGSAHMRLAPGAGILRISTGPMVSVAINTRTFAVSANGGRWAPTPAAIRTAPHARRDSSGLAGLPWELILPLLAALPALGVVLALRARRARPGASAARGWFVEERRDQLQ